VTGEAAIEAKGLRKAYGTVTALDGIDQGRVIAEGSSDELKDRVDGERLEVTLEEPGQADAAIAALAPMATELPVVEDAMVRVPMQRRRGAIVEAVRRLDQGGVGVADIGIRRPTLDDVFFALTGHAAEEQQPEEQEAA
jgi:ABC-2 type transport system ATP-binding protein